VLSTTPFVVTIHDLNYLDRTATAGAGGERRVGRAARRAGYRIELAKVRRARRLIAVSEHTRAAVVRALHVDPSRVALTYGAADPTGEAEPDTAILERHGLDEPFFLYVGAAYPYKNLPRLLEALGRSGSGRKLVLAGDQEDFAASLRQHAAELGLGDRVLFTGPVSEAELAALYGGALAYAFVSLSEGFGLPGLEAMTAGVPVVAASAGSLPEVYRDAARYCDPLDVESIATALDEVASDGQLRNGLVARGRERAGEFSWARTAEQTLAVYREALLH
jgi:glycosyltransferase involved in cell wall biosynthesis